jgi:hypothetical protein
MIAFLIFLLVASVLFFVSYRREVLRQVAITNARLESAEADADRLAAIVREYVRVCDETAALLKDDQPPAMTNERLALSEHEKLVQSRNDPDRQHQS